MSKQNKNIFHELPIDYKDFQEILSKQGKIIGSAKLSILCSTCTKLQNA